MPGLLLSFTLAGLQIWVCMSHTYNMAVHYGGKLPMQRPDTAAGTCDPAVLAVPAFRCTKFQLLAHTGHAVLKALGTSQQPPQPAQGSHSQAELALHVSLQDVVYGLLNIKAMQLVGGGAQNFQQWFDFLGLIKDKQPTGIGAPYQMDFPGEQALPTGMTAMKEGIPTCWDPAFKCSCGDCPDAPQCVPVSWSMCCSTSVALSCTATTWCAVDGR